jgi:hypothetical protein
MLADGEGDHAATVDKGLFQILVELRKIER